MYKILFSMCVCSLVVSGLAAEEKSSHVYIAPAWEYLTSNWGGGVSQKGSLGGVNGGYTYAARDTIYFNAEFTYMAGMLRGSAGNDPTQEYITDVKLGYDISEVFGENFTMTPFIGMGSYIFNQSLAGHAKFESNFWYVPIGVMFCYKINPSWSIAFMGLGAPTFSGHWKVTQGGGSGKAPTSALWKGEVPIIYTGSRPFELSLVPFVKGWSYHHNGGLTEQKNAYYGLKAVFGYRF